MASRSTAFKVTPGRVKPLLIAAISAAVCIACVYAMRTSLNGVELWAGAAVSAVVALAGVVIALLQQPLLEVNGETLSLRDGALRGPVRVQLRHIRNFVLDSSGAIAQLRVILAKDAEAAYRTQGAMESPETGMYFVVPLAWISGDKMQIVNRLNALIRSSQLS